MVTCKLKWLADLCFIKNNDASGDEDIIKYFNP